MSQASGLSYLSDKLVQVAYVVEDFEKSMEFFRVALGVEKFYVWDLITKDQTDKIYRGKPGEFEFSAAYGYSGDVQIELCKHVSGENVYKDWLAERGIGMHHTGYLLDDGDDFARAFKHLDSQGFEVAMAGRLGECQWTYFDTVSVVGSYTEIYWIPDDIAHIFEKMKRGEDPFAD
jgi:catechol 2,3-dioxygenase-like lactoylglutathione lyase family enzyme